VSPDPFDDDLDRALKSGLSALAPYVGGDDDALTSLRPRFQRARTRNRVAKIGGALVALAAIASVAALAAPSSGRTHVQVSSPGTTASDPTSTPAPSSSSTTSTTASVPAVTGPAASTASSSVPHSSNLSGSSPTTPVTVPGTTPGPAPIGNDSGNGGGNGHGQGSPGTTDPSQNGAKKYDSQGGSIIVRFSHGDLTLLHVSPADGYSSSVDHNEASDIDVRFENDNGGWRVRVRVENGHVTSEVGHT
jgi:hypothetical protein